MLATVMGHTTIDRFRYTIEQMPPAEYLASSYYERWLWAIEHLAAEQGLLDSAERPAPVPRPSPATPTWAGGSRPAIGSECEPGHERPHPGPAVPPPARGPVERVAFAWPNPTESAATGTYGEPELVYTVAFAAADLFGPAADHTITADLGESDLEEP